MKKFDLKTMFEISAEQQANLTAGSNASSCSCTCGTCSCSCSSESPSGVVKDATSDVQDSTRHVASDANK